MSIGHRRERGFTLIEVLVSILIFAIGVLGLVALQARSVQSANDSQDRNRAASLANELASNMWAAHTGDVTNTTTNLSNFYNNTWLAEVAASLPNGVGSASAPDATTGAVVVTINWYGSTRAATAQAETYTTELVVQ